MDCSQFCPTGKLERLLVATDGSAFSEGAIREAISFAKKCSSRMYALSVLETNPEYETIGSDVFDKEEAEVKRGLESVRERASREGVACETIFLHGSEPHQQIVDEAAEKKVDMIVIGRRGRKGLLKALMGEVASKVIAHATCKVLVVPKSAQIGYRTLLVATDGSEHARAAAAEAVSIAKRCGSSLIALSAKRSESEHHDATAHVNEVAELARKEGVPVETVTSLGRSYNVIVETAGGRGVDLIVMGTYGKTGMKKLLMGSSTEKVIGTAGCAVLVVR